MNNIYGSQGIACNVNSCAYNDGDACTLDSIQVGAMTNSSTGLAEDETLCQSYKKRDDQTRPRDYLNNYSPFPL